MKIMVLIDIAFWTKLLSSSDFKESTTKKILKIHVMGTRGSNQNRVVTLHTEDIIQLLSKCCISLAIKVPSGIRSRYRES